MALSEMDPVERRELKRKAWLRLAAQRRRAGFLRGRVVAISMICFAALWTIVFVQMETGKDPVLAGKEKAFVTRTSAGTRGEEGGSVEPEPKVEEPEFVAEPLVTSQS